MPGYCHLASVLVYDYEQAVYAAGSEDFAVLAGPAVSSFAEAALNFCYAEAAAACFEAVLPVCYGFAKACYVVAF